MVYSLNEDSAGRMVEQSQETIVPDPKLRVLGGDQSFEVPFGV
jgi:hypothetical protein